MTENSATQYFFYLRVFTHLKKKELLFCFIACYTNGLCCTFKDLIQKMEDELK